MDITRILHPTDKDLAKMERHKKEYYLLLNVIVKTCSERWPFTSTFRLLQSISPRALAKE
ncbi:hypothetical protein DXC95_17100 [Parabacteroides sp. 20_3]|jgi:hypothetical protein|nr:hypothetical protein DXC95_17100 [Parabacteroides sp. 20_3]